MRWYLFLAFLIAVSVACTGSESTATSSPTATASPSPTATATPSPTATATPSLSATDTPTATATPSPTTAVDSGSISIVTTASGLQIKDLVVGTGQRAQVGDTAFVHYTGWLEDGTKFGSWTGVPTAGNGASGAFDSRSATSAPWSRDGCSANGVTSFFLRARRDWVSWPNIHGLPPVRGWTKRNIRTFQPF